MINNIDMTTMGLIEDKKTVLNEISQIMRAEPCNENNIKRVKEKLREIKEINEFLKFKIQA